MKISIITPCFNAEKYIEETIDSVISQRGDFDIEYIIVDGGSTDRTLNIIGKAQSKIQSSRYSVRSNGVNMRVISEPDNGMYDALAKGLRMVSGDVVAYQNADDYYLPNAFSAVVTTFKHYKAIKWLTGVISGYNEDGNVCFQKLPYKYEARYIRMGVYGKELPFIQQESCFWRRDLLSGIDFKELAAYKYAGDFFLWSRFAEQYELRILNVPLSGFRKHGENKSDDMDAYWLEFNNCTCGNYTVEKDEQLLLHRKAWQFSSDETLQINPSIIRLNQPRLRWIKQKETEQFVESDNSTSEMKPKISIITVTYNDIEGLKTTLPSVASQLFSNYEYIVIDGASTDGSKDFIEKHADKIDLLVSEADEGIYYAMNKGIQRARGEWIIFMNAGDCFVDECVLNNVVAYLQGDEAVVYGDRFYKALNGKKKLDRARPVDTMFNRMPFCHQSTFVRAELMKQQPFNLTYKYAADYEFFVKQYVEEKKFLHITMPVCIFSEGGKSESGLRPHLEVVKILLDWCDDKNKTQNSAYLKSFRKGGGAMLEAYFAEKTF